MSPASVYRRCREIWGYARLSQSWIDSPQLLILGLARRKDFSRRGPVSYVGRKLFPRLWLRPRLLNGISIVLNPSDGSQIDIFDEVIVSNLYDLSRLTFSPELILDCGGHIGLFSARAASHFPGARLIVFEPVPRNDQFIHDMKDRNDLKIEIRNQAVSNADGERQFFECNSCGGSLEPGAGKLPASYKVTCVNLIDLLQKWSPSSLLLKMDIEGEEEVLLPQLVGTLPQKCAIFFETHRGEEGWSAVAGALETAGFTVTTIRKRPVFVDGFASRG